MGKCREVVGDFLSVAVLVIVVLVIVMVWDVAWVGAIVWGCRRRVLGIVVGELVPDGADDGTDPVSQGALMLSF